MTSIIIILLIVFFALLIYLLSLDGHYHVDRSLLIDAPIEKVFAAVVDFKTWSKWSPWLLHEPDARLEFSDDYQAEKGYYRWDGERVGSGKLTHISIAPHLTIQQQIEFFRPFKSVSDVCWSFREVDGKTEVHWMMTGTMPFFLRFFTAMTARMIAQDYDLGLHLLNGYLDARNPHPQIRFCGEQPLQGFDYAAQPFRGQLGELKQAMQQTFPALMQKAGDLKLIAGAPVTIYHKADTEKMWFECDMGVPLTSTPADGALQVKHFAGGKYYKTECHGDYRFLELAWYKAHSQVQMLKLKIDKKRPSMEVYENDPTSVEDSNQILTSIYLPIK